MGGDDAFEVFFEAYERQLRAFALRRTRSPRAADELVAAVMEVAWRRFDRGAVGVAVRMVVRSGVADCSQ